MTFEEFKRIMVNARKKKLRAERVAVLKTFKPKLTKSNRKRLKKLKS